MSRPASAIPPGQTAPRYLRQGNKLLNAVVIAKAQKWLLWLVLGMVITYTGIFVGSMQHPAIALAVGVIYLALVACSMVMVGRLARAVGYSWVSVVLLCLGLLFPLIGLLIVLSINGRATTLIKLTGAKVGFMGVPEREMHKLYAGVCSGCGYSLKDLVGDVCPECGAHVQLA